MKITDLLIEQLRQANSRWEILEKARMRILELHLSFFGITGVGLIIANENTSLFNNASDIVKIALPFLFLFVGLGFFTMFLYKEHYFRIAKSRLKRIEEELQLYVDEGKIPDIKIYTGAYYPYYYKASTAIDFVTIVLGFSIFITTILIVFLTSFIFTPYLILFNTGISFLLMVLTMIIISSHNKKAYRENSDKYPPKIDNINYP